MAALLEAFQSQTFRALIPIPRIVQDPPWKYHLQRSSILILQLRWILIPGSWVLILGLCWQCHRVKAGTCQLRLDRKAPRSLHHHQGAYLLCLLYLLHLLLWLNLVLFLLHLPLFLLTRLARKTTPVPANVFHRDTVWIRWRPFAHRLVCIWLLSVYVWLCAPCVPD